MKKSIIITAFVLMLTLFTAIDTSANNEVIAEKVWSIKMNLEVLDTEENLSLIKVMDENKNEIPIKISISEDDKKVLEITPLDFYEIDKSYMIHVPKGFKSQNDLILNASVSYDFSISGNFDDAMLSKTWNTVYVTSQETTYNITATFKDGKADIMNVNEFGDREYTKGNYSIDKGNLKMDIMNPLKPTSVIISLDGKVGWYNEKHFKITNDYGSTAHFVVK